MLTSMLFVLLAGQSEPALRISGDARQPRVSVRLPADIAAKLPANLTQEQGEALLRFALVVNGKEGPPMLGTYERHKDTLVFAPRFPLAAEKTYRARLMLAGGAALTRDYTAPPRAAGPPAHVVKVYPTSDVLPANQLRFYIYFSQPMRGGADIFKQIRLVDDKGETVLEPWLTDELWDDDGKLLILYIHPGRIKWGVLLRILFGPALYPDRAYTLVIPGEMLDAEGRRLGKDYTKKFRTTAEERTRIAVEDWKVRAPAAGGTAALVVDFPRAVDHLGMAKFITIRDAKGQPVAGKVTVGAGERSMQFIPAQPWRGEEYKLVVDGRLEDVGGNTPRRPFDMDPKSRVPERPELERPFRAVEAR